jgi:hypothetical protein
MLRPTPGACSSGLSARTPNSNRCIVGHATAAEAGAQSQENVRSALIFKKLSGYRPVHGRTLNIARCGETLSGRSLVTHSLRALAAFRVFQHERVDTGGHRFGKATSGIWEGSERSAFRTPSAPLKATRCAGGLRPSLTAAAGRARRNFHLLKIERPAKTRARRTERGVWNHKTLPVHPWSR